MSDTTGHTHTADQEHDPNVQHHFSSAHQQFDAAVLGMWVFLITELLFFSALFCAYAVYRQNHPEIFAIGHKFLDPTMGAINTVVLILSSFTMALAVYMIQRNRQRATLVCLGLTFLGACIFMGIKSYEYADKIQKGKTWGASFSYDKYYQEHHGAAHEGEHGDEQAAHAASQTAAGEVADSSHDQAETAPAVEQTTIVPAAQGPAGMIDPRTIVLARGEDSHDLTLADLTRKDLHIFMAIYFCMTGLHGIHVLAGMGVILWLMINTARGRYNDKYNTPIPVGGLYWHLVDLVWIYLFPLLYLIH